MRRSADRGRDSGRRPKTTRLIRSSSASRKNSILETVFKGGQVDPVGPLYNQRSIYKLGGCIFRDGLQFPIMRTEVIESSDARVSTVIPYSQDYTSEILLEEAIESVQSQNIGSDVIIVYDDNNRGPSWARNRGLELTNKRYVAFLDADDKWKPRKLDRQLTKLRSTNSGICVEGIERKQHSFAEALVVGDVSALTPSIVIDRSKVSATFDEELDRFEDHLFILQAMSQSGICFCEDLVIIRRQPEGLSSSTSIDFIFDQNLKYAAKLVDVGCSKRLKTKCLKMAHYRAGRQYQKAGRVLRGCGHLLESLRKEFSWKVLFVTLLSPIYVTNKVFSN